MKSIAERLQFLTRNIEKSAEAFYERTSLSRQTLRGNINGTTKPNYKTLDSILKTYPNISAEWLMRGDGSVFIDSGEIVKDGATLYKRIDLIDSTNLKHLLADISKKIDSLEEFRAKVEGKPIDKAVEKEEKPEEEKTQN